MNELQRAEARWIQFAISVVTVVAFFAIAILGKGLDQSLGLSLALIIIAVGVFFKVLISLKTGCVWSRWRCFTREDDPFRFNLGIYLSLGGVVLFVVLALLVATGVVSPHETPALRKLSLGQVSR